MRRPSPALDLAELAKAVAPHVAELLARSLIAGSSPAYSTREGDGPPGIADRIWKKIAPGIPGSYKIDRCRWTIVPRSAFDAWVTAGRSAPQAAPPANETPWSPEAALASVGLRASGGSK